MHADEKSDGVTVPEKRPNNEGLPSAEVVEGRTPLKGNGGQAAAVRTQRRGAASNGPTAKDERFTALLHHITTELLKRSYLALARDAAPGIERHIALWFMK
jgi:RNA-directed DNA polymerase